MLWAMNKEDRMMKGAKLDRRLLVLLAALIFSLPNQFSVMQVMVNDYITADAGKEERRSFVNNLPFVNIIYERLPEQFHGRMGAIGPNGEENYVFDPTRLRKNPPTFTPNCSYTGTKNEEALRKVVVSSEDRPDYPDPDHRSKILCFLYSHEGKHNTSIQAIRETWGNKFDGFGVASSTTSLEYDAVLIRHQGPESYGNMWQKVRSMWIYIYEHYYNDYDWFYVGGDDMLVIVENMRAYLDSREIREAATLGTTDKNYQRPLYLGSTLAEQGNLGKLYNTGGSGYLLNKAALKLLVTKGIPVHQIMRKTSAEDVKVAQALQALGVTPYNTTDFDNRARFMHFSPERHFLENEARFWKRYTQPLNYRHGPDHYSSASIAFHYIHHHLMNPLFSQLYNLCSATIDE